MALFPQEKARETYRAISDCSGTAGSSPCVRDWRGRAGQQARQVVEAGSFAAGFDGAPGKPDPVMQGCMAGIRPLNRR
ncbi:MAG: hypothetical protein JEZ04_22435 [Spirochaetales bacterium]|nr:hypothetical protein [Spirochaetales bacterium]